MFILGACLASFSCAARWSGSIGAVLGKDNRDGRVYVREAPRDMGAAKAGVELGDEVTAIDGKPVPGMSPEDIHKALSGSVGSKVTLTVSRAEQIVTVEVERGPLRGE
jgi:C-terminal processing protease CtpA/Prc